MMITNRKGEYGRWKKSGGGGEEKKPSKIKDEPFPLQLEGRKKWEESFDSQ